MEKNNKLVIVLLIVIITMLSVLCFLFATDKIVLNSNKPNTNPNQNTSEKNKKTDNEGTNQNWADYLSTCNIVEAKIGRLRSKELGDTEDIDKTITITKAQVKEILSNLKNNKLAKIWNEGLGGPPRDNLTIIYEKNGQKYEFYIHHGGFTDKLLDNEMKTILENNSIERNTEVKDMPGADYFYAIIDFDETLFDKYFK